MKRTIIILFISVISFSAFTQIPSSKTIEKLASFEKNKLANRALSTPVGQTIDVKYEQLNFYIDSLQHYIRGKILFVIRSTTDDNQVITLNLDGLTVDSVVSHHSALSFSHDSDVLSITLSTPLSLNETDSFTVFYQGTPAVSSPYFVCEKRGAEQILTLSTMSESYSAKYWMPVKQVLSDKIDSVDIYIRYPKQYRSSSNGLLLDSIIDGNYRIDHWHHRHPVNYYLIAFAVTNYSVVHKTLIDSYRQFSMPVDNYLFPEQLGDTTNLPNLLDVIKLYDSLFIPYPFNDEHYAQTHFLVGGGMEHQTNSFVQNLDFELTAHELAHQWFGDYITCNSWKDIWLNEGFTTYLSALSYEHLLDGRWWPVWKQVAIDKATSNIYGSVYCTDTTDENRIFNSRLSYYKGAMVLHMLRWVLGDSSFFAGIQNYLLDTNLAWKTATTNDLISHLETAGDTDLTEFMTDWFYGNGYPVYSVTAQKKGNDSLIVSIHQTTTEYASVSFFRMPVAITVYTDSVPTVFRLNNDWNDQEFTLYYPQNVDSIFFDKERWILTKPVKVKYLSVDAQDFSSVINVFPNPANDKLFIEIPVNETLKQIRIIAPDGKCVQTSNELTIDLSNFADGNYFVEIHTTTRIVKKKILIVR